MDNKVTKDWMYFERLLSKITLIVFGLSFLLLGVILLLVEKIGAWAETIMYPIFGLWAASILIFFISAIRIIMFLFKKNKNEGDTITKSVRNLLLSPIAFLVYYLLIFIVALSSCST